MGNADTTPCSWRVPSSDWVTMERVSPRECFLQCDVFFGIGTVAPAGFLALLIDGAPGRGATTPRFPRRHLFNLVSSRWSAIVGASPREILQELDDACRERNRSSTELMYLSAAVARFSTAGGTAEIAEAGDTKAWRVSAGAAVPLWTEGTPREDHRAEGALGTSAPAIRAKQVPLPEPEAIALMTDGAYEVLTQTDGQLPGQLAEEFRRRATQPDDDASLVLLSPWGQ